MLTLGYNSVLLVSVHYGNGKHLVDIPNYTDKAQAVRLPYITQPLSAFSIIFVKFSVATTLMNLRLGRTFNVIIGFIMVIVTGASLASGFYPLVAMKGCEALAYTVHPTPKAVGACSGFHTVSILGYLQNGE